MTWTGQRRERFLARSDDPEFLAFDRWERSVLRSVAAGARTIIDAGCGNGRFFDLWADVGAEVVAIDADPVMCELAAQHPSATSGAVAVACGSLPMALAPADLAVCIRVLPSLSATEADAVASCLCRSARTVVLQVLVDDGGPESAAIAAAGGHRFDPPDAYAPRGDRSVVARHLAPTGPSQLHVIHADHDRRKVAT